MHDLVIQHGTIIDGTGSDRKAGDVAIDNGRISAIEPAGTARGRKVINARDHLVTPGWVDVHTHYDGQATWDPLMGPSSWHGVTSVIMGNCGVGFAPVRPGQQQFLIELMEGVEDIPGAALAEGIDWQWESFPQYLDALETMARTIDVGTQVPHGAVRAYVMGDQCNTDEVPTAEQIAQMAALVREGVSAGALGFSTSRTLLHRDNKGVHVPGTFAGSDEMLALGLAMKGLNHGMYEMVSDHLGDDDEWAWVLEFARQTKLPVTLVPTSAAAYEGGKIYKIAEEARQAGLDIRPQMAGRPTGILHGLQSSFHLFARNSVFAKEVGSLPDLAAQVAKMRDPDVRARILAEPPELGPGLLGATPEKMLALVFPLGEKPNYEPDRVDSVAGIAEARGEEALAVMYDLLLRDDGRELFYQPLGGYASYDFSFYAGSMQHPNVLFGLSDGGAHCGVIADAGMPTFILTHWGRDRTKGDQLPLEFLVRKLSSDTADAYGIKERGRLVPGNLADINIIDFDALQLHRPEAVFDLPTGGRRLVQHVDGYRYTLKGGQVTFDQGEHTGALPGGLIRGG